MKTYLNVPYSEHDEARRLGANWDIGRKKWFVENQGNLQPFLKWMEDHLKKPYVSLVEASPKPKRHTRPDQWKLDKIALRKKRAAQRKAEANPNA